MGGYRELFDASVADPAAFWAQAARAVTWTRAPEQILDDTNPPFYRWFPDAELNTCANALDRHVDAGRGDQAGADLRLPRHRREAHLDLPRTAVGDSPFRRSAA